MPLPDARAVASGAAAVGGAGAGAPHSGVVPCYLAGTVAVLDLLRSPALADSWSTPSVLPQWDCAGLAAHLARSVLQVDEYLPPAGELVVPDPAARRLSAEVYYARLVGTTDLGSDLNERVRARSAVTAAPGHDAVVSATVAALGRLRERLPGEPVGQHVRLAHHAGELMALPEYLRTRCVEIAVHLDDLARSLAIEDPTPGRVRALAVDVLLGAARCRHGDAAVLTALTRRERSDSDVLRVL